MEREDYLTRLEERLSYYYDIARDICYNNVDFDLYAHFYERDERYIGTKKTVIHSAEINQHLFIKHFERLTQEGFDKLIQTAILAGRDYVEAKDGHMSSLINMIMLVEEMPPDSLLKKIERYKYYKSFLWGIHGWVNVALVLVNIRNCKVVYNRRGRKGKDVFLFC